MIIGRDRDLDPSRDRPGYLTLQVQNVAVVAVIALCPKLCLIADQDELGSDPQPLSRAADAALQDVVDAQLLTYLFDCLVGLLVLEGTRPGDHSEFAQRCQAAGDLLRNPIGEVLILW